jgi:hypothetical protein
MAVNRDDGLLAAQQRYARWLAWGTRSGVVLLVLAFILYVTGAVVPYVPIERLPELWHLPAAEYLHRTGIDPGWHGWARLIAHGDMLVLAAIALLIACSIFCLAGVVPVFWRRRERLLAIVCLLQIAVLALAASGLLAR